MALLMKNLVLTTNIPSAVGSVFANPTDKKSYIKIVLLHNTNTTSETVKLYRVPNNAGSVGTANDNTNRIFKTILAADDTFQIEIPGQGWVFENLNDSLQAVTTTASKVVITVDGAEE